MRRESGFTIIEVLVALSLFALVIALVMPLFLLSIKTNEVSRVRTTTTGVAESWLDRYRSNQEPLVAGGPCVTLAPTLGVGVVCTYPQGFNFSTDGVTSHAADSASLNQKFSLYTSVITATRVIAGTSTELWEVKASVQPQQSNVGRDKLAVLTTRYIK